MRDCVLKVKKIGVFSILLLLITALLIAAGCNEDKPKNYEINPSDLTADVLEHVKFSTEMSEVDRDTLASVWYTVPDGVNAAAYVAGGALSDELIVFTAPDEAIARTMLENVNKHINERKELFQSYAPAEVAKLEKAYAIQKGKYVVVCVTSDIDNAKTIIDKHF